ncbi:MAG: hypothetical protein V9G11_04800 [Bifidobacterium adolescentis]
MVALIQPACATEPTTPPPAPSRGKSSPTPDPLSASAEAGGRLSENDVWLGLEIPPWLRQIEEELNRVQDADGASGGSDLDVELALPPNLLNLRETHNNSGNRTTPSSPAARKNQKP